MKTTIFISLLPIACGMTIPPQDKKWQFDDSRWLMRNFNYIGDPETGNSLHFNLTSDPTASEPSISVDCEIWRDQPYWQPCSMLIAKSADWNRGVWVMPLPTTDTINLKIMHAFTDASGHLHIYYNLTGEYHGNWQGVTFPVNPTVKPTYSEWRTGDYDYDTMIEGQMMA